MRGFLVRLLVGALALLVATAIVPGMAIQGIGTLLGAAVLLGFVNAVIRPLMVKLTFPVTFVTLGLFLLVINGAMLGLVSLMLDNFRFTGFGDAVAGAMVVSVVSWIASWLTGPNKKDRDP